MLSIGAMGHGQGNYYIDLAQGDYYTEGGEPPGVWLGEGAEKLGLSGQVQKEAFLRVFHGFSPDTDRALIQNAGEESHQPGWDLTFSAPKSVSTIWAVLDPETRKAIEAAQFAAVKETLAYLEEEAAYTRRGKGGKIQEKVSLVAATFEHGTSRAHDPQLHTHALILNVGVREDGTTGTILSKPFYQAKMLSGALYRMELSRRLEMLGFTVERSGSSFEITGIPEQLTKEFSKRRTAIEATLEKRGKQSAQAAAVAALDTRKAKEHIARAVLFPQWEATAARFEFTEETAKGLRQPFQERDIRAETKAVLKIALARLSQNVSHFSEREFLRGAAEAGQGRGLSIAHLRAAVAYQLESGNLIALGERGQEMRYTTPEIFALEKKLLSSVESLQRGKSFAVSEDTLQEAIRKAEASETRKARAKDPEAEERHLNAEQRKALAHITQGKGQIAVVSGMAGTGKTFLLQAARETWQQEGYRILGATISGKAARGLSKGAGIGSVTIAKLLYEWGRESLSETATKKQTYSFENYSLNAKTILVVDEAGMVGTAKMETLASACQNAGAKLVLIGDRRQIQPVEMGGPLRAIQERIGCAELKEIVRQELDKADKNPYWKREAVTAFAEGRAKDALCAYDERGFVHKAENRERAMQNLVNRWSEKGTVQAKDNLIFAGTNRETKALNAMAQGTRKSAGKLGFRSVTIAGETIHEKDRIMITEGNKRLGVSNGDLGTVKRLDLVSGQMLVALDSGEEVSLPFRSFQKMTLGYAVTTHKGQGVTVKNAFVLCGGVMADRELSYVQASRARRDTHFFSEAIYVWDEQENKKIERTIPELSRQMSRSRQKDIAHDVQEKPQQRGQELELLPTL